MNEPAVRIQFEGTDPAEAGRYGQELREEILGAIPDARVSLEREDKEAQDLGSILLAALPVASDVLKHAASTVTAHLLLGVIHSWWERRGRPAMQISGPAGAEAHVDAQSARPEEILATIEKALTNQ